MMIIIIIYVIIFIIYIIVVIIIIVVIFRLRVRRGISIERISMGTLIVVMNVRRSITKKKIIIVVIIIVVVFIIIIIIALLSCVPYRRRDPHWCVAHGCVREGDVRGEGSRAWCVGQGVGWLVRGRVVPWKPHLKGVSGCL